jgi:group I intron endonuclease
LAPLWYNVGMENNMSYIYVLTAPGGSLSPSDVRYVGKTTQRLKRRLNMHISDSARHKHYCANWIKSLTNQGLHPEIHMVTIVPECGSGINEKYWISYYRGCGSNLTNLTEGGEGIPGYVCSKSLRELRSRAAKNISEETRRKRSKALSGEKNPMFGKHPSDATKKLLSEAMSGEKNPMFGRTGEKSPMFGKQHSDAAKKLMSEANSGGNHPLFGKKHSDETKKLMSEVKLGKRFSDEHKKRLSEAIAKSWIKRREKQNG